jgi:hypothetical protein
MEYLEFMETTCKWKQIVKDELKAHNVHGLDIEIVNGYPTMMQCDLIGGIIRPNCIIFDPFYEYEHILSNLPQAKQLEYAEEIRYFIAHGLGWKFALLHEIGHIKTITEEWWKCNNGMQVAGLYRNVGPREYRELPWESAADDYALEAMRQYMKEVANE